MEFFFHFSFQGLFFGPIPLKVFLCHMFVLTGTEDIASYADGNTPYTIGKNQYEVKKKEIASAKLPKWFRENGIKTNHDKYYFVSSLDITTKFSLTHCSIENSKC